jgi:hypothetical protein
MYAVEFQAIVQNGVIAIPEQCQTDLPSHVRVIIIADKFVEHGKNENIIKRLMKSPRNVGNFRPMTREEIYEQS